MSCRSYRLRPRTLREHRSTSRHHRPSLYSFRKSMFPRMPGRPLLNVVGETPRAIPATKSTCHRVAALLAESPHRALGCPVRLSFTANETLVTVTPRRLKHPHPLITRAPSLARLRLPLPRPPIARPTKLPPRTATRRVPTIIMDLQPRPRPSPPLLPASCTRTLHHRARPTGVRRLKKNMRTRTAPVVGETATPLHSRFRPVPASAYAW